jgi:hypothetical protein
VRPDIETDEGSSRCPKNAVRAAPSRDATKTTAWLYECPTQAGLPHPQAKDGCDPKHGSQAADTVRVNVEQESDTYGLNLRRVQAQAVNHTDARAPVARPSPSRTSAKAGADN